MGIPGAGKTRVARRYAGGGHERLNRDELGGSLREIAAALDDVLASGTARVVLDNTYLTRAGRSRLIEIAARHGLPTRCVWLDTPLVQAQVNMVERILDRLGSLPTPEELKQAARREPGLHTPTTQMRTLRELEPPELDEGFSEVERVAFERAPAEGIPGVFVAAAALASRGWEQAVAEIDPTAPHLVFDWRPDGATDELDPAADLLAQAVQGPVDRALCAHGGGPPTCWCRPPLPGLPLAFARAHSIDPSRSTLVGTSTAHRTLATTLGARFVTV
jgi:hypothetical protein